MEVGHSSEKTDESDLQIVDRRRDLGRTADEGLDRSRQTDDPAKERPETGVPLSWPPVTAASSPRLLGCRRQVYFLKRQTGASCNFLTSDKTNGR